jgi:hypothetical protein
MKEITDEQPTNGGKHPMRFDERIFDVAKDISFFLVGQPEEKAAYVLDKMRENLNAQLAGVLPESFVDLLVGAISARRLEIQCASHPSTRMMQ